MKRTPETVWDWYLAEHAAEQSEEERRLLKALHEKQGTVKPKFTQKTFELGEIFFRLLTFHLKLAII